MSRHLQGFKAFFVEGDLSPVSPESGYAELSRLERGHYFFVIQTDYKTAEYFMRGHLMGGSFLESSPTDSGGIEKRIQRLTPEKDSLVVVCFPKRWEKSLGRNLDVKKIFGEMISQFGKSAQYVWGVYSLWNPLMDSHDFGHFFRNPEYHANDELLDVWLKKYPSPIKEKPAVPLNRQPRVMGHHLLDQGRQAFHGYNSSPEANQSSGVN